MSTRRYLHLHLGLTGIIIAAPFRSSPQSFASFPAGDDITSSLGQFQIVLDQAWVKTFDLLITNSPFANVLATRHLRLYHNGVLTSPTLYDPATTIGRSASFLSGAPQDAEGALAGQGPVRTFITDSQLTLRPGWSEITPGVHEIHTFIKSFHLIDSFTTQAGFSVRAGILAPTRPVSAGEIEGGSPLADFPANSFFNVYVQVDLPPLGLLPAIQLVNVDPLLVQQTNILSLPPRVIYQHANSTAVSLYFNQDVSIPDPSMGVNIAVTRGTLFGQLTLAGHGVSFGEFDVDAFQTEIETESENGSMPVNPTPIPSVVIQDFSPDYGASLPVLGGGHFGSDGSFTLSINLLRTNSPSYLQASTNLIRGNWQTIATIPAGNTSFTVVDTNAPTSPQRFYRWTEAP